MKLRQKNLRLFELEIEDFDTFVSYMDKNGELFVESFLLLKGNICQKVIQYLQDRKICYKDINSCKIKSSSKEQFELLIKEQTPISIEEPKKVVEATKKELYDRPIRSGEHLVLQQCTTITARINSGATISSAHSLELFGTIDGVVECSGAYLILRSIANGSVSFKGQSIDKSMLDGKFKLIQFQDGTVVYKDIS